MKVKYCPNCGASAREDATWWGTPVSELTKCPDCEGWGIESILEIAVVGEA